MTSSLARLFLVIFAFTLLSGAPETRRALSHDAYIWQRKWTPAVGIALLSSSDLVRAWRVLAAHSNEGGRLRQVAVNWEALKSSKRPVIAVALYPTFSRRKTCLCVGSVSVPSLGRAEACFALARKAS